jgi:hypothetical protein
MLHRRLGTRASSEQDRSSDRSGGLTRRRLRGRRFVHSWEFIRRRSKLLPQILWVFTSHAREFELPADRETTKIPEGDNGSEQNAGISRKRTSFAEEDRFFAGCLAATRITIWHARRARGAQVSLSVCERIVKSVC